MLKATAVVKDLWPVLQTVASTVSSVTSAIGAGNLAYAAMGLKVVSLTSASESTRHGVAPVL